MMSGLIDRKANRIDDRAVRRSLQLPTETLLVSPRFATEFKGDDKRLITRRSLLLASAPLIIVAPRIAKAHLLYKQGSSYQGVGDITSFDFWAGCRAYSAAYAASHGNAFDLRRSSGGTMTAVVLSDGSLDVGSISSWAGADTIFITGAYNQSGGSASHVTQPTAGNQLTLLLSGGRGNKPYILVTASKFLSSTSTFAPSNGVVSFTTVAYRNGTNIIRFISNNGDGGNVFAANDQGTANRWMLKRTTATTTRFNVVASDSAWHVAQGIMNGASSVVQVDGSDTTGSVTGDTITATFRMASGGDGRLEEAGFKDGTAWNSTIYGALTTNQQAAY